MIGDYAIQAANRQREEYLKSTKVKKSTKYFDSFENCSDIMNEFKVSKAQQISGRQIIFAAYGTEEEYEGEALVIFEKNGKLYEVNGSHCSCMRLEGQWKPEETTWAALAMRTLNSDWNKKYSDETDAAFKTLVNANVGNRL